MTETDRDYRHRHIDIDIRQKERRIYIPEFWQERFNKLQTIVEREGSSISEWFRKQADPYIDLHEPGNPQQRIDIIATTGHPYRAPLLCACGRKATRKNTLNNGEIVYSCSLHAPAKERVRMWKPIK